MPSKAAILKDESGFVLALAMFMLALLTVIGMAAMMTSTIETEIAGNEKSQKTAFYQAETGPTMGAEVLESLGGYDSYADNYSFVNTAKLPDGYTLDVKVNHGEFLYEARDIDENGNWNYGDDCIDSVNKTGTEAGPDIEMTMKKDSFTQTVNRIDVDKIAVRWIAGGGTEFAAGAEGMGVSTHKVIYNIDSIGILPRNTAIQSEIILGYRFVPR